MLQTLLINFIKIIKAGTHKARSIKIAEAANN